MENFELVTLVGGAFAELGGWLRLHQGRLLAAAALLLLGWILGLLLRALVSKILRGLQRMIPERLLRRGGPDPVIESRVSEIIGHIVFWMVLLFFVAAAADVVGVPVLGVLLAGVGQYLPRIIAAVLLVAGGLIIGNLARDAAAAAAAAAGSPFAAAIGQIVRAIIFVVTGLIAIAELGVDITLLTAVLSVTLLAVLSAFSLAFGLGAREAVSNIIGAHYARQTFEIGRQVKIGDVEGTIAAITATSVIVQSAGGQVVIPAKLFNETMATLVTPGGTA